MTTVSLDWSRRPAGSRGSRFYRLAVMDADARYVCIPGVYVLFSAIDSDYLAVGQAADVGAAIKQLRDHLPISSVPRDEILVTWARIDDEHTRLSVDRYLAERLQPALTALRSDRPPIRCNNPYLG